jgi:hypothetical protein
LTDQKQTNKKNQKKERTLKKNPSKMSTIESRVWEVSMSREHLNFDFDFILTFLLS